MRGGMDDIGSLTIQPDTRARISTNITVQRTSMTSASSECKTQLHCCRVAMARGSVGLGSKRTNSFNDTPPPAHGSDEAIRAAVRPMPSGSAADS